MKKNNAKEVLVKLAYAIGKPLPVMAIALIDNRQTEISGFDLTPRGIREFLKLDKIKFADTAQWGHFGRSFAWDIQI